MSIRTQAASDPVRRNWIVIAAVNCALFALLIIGARLDSLYARPSRPSLSGMITRTGIHSSGASDVAGNQSSAMVTVSYEPVFYVDGITGDDSNPGSSSAPWKTIQKAADTIGPGATVNVNAGTYDERVRVSR